MIDATLIINGRDFSGRLSTYAIEHEVEYGSILQTMDGTEHVGPQRIRDTIVFSFFPVTDDQAKEDYAILTSGVLEVAYTDPDSEEATRYYSSMRLDSDLSRAYPFRSINGNRYYKGGEIRLRSLRVR